MLRLRLPPTSRPKTTLKRMVEETDRVFGPVDTLVCNATSNPCYYGPQAGISDDQFRATGVNDIVANRRLISLVAPQMIARKDGSITIISSIGGLKGSTVLGAYAISKAADMQLAQPRLRIRPAQHSRELHCARPDRNRARRALWENPETLKASSSRSPLLRIGEPDEIAGAAVFLASVPVPSRPPDHRDQQAAPRLVQRILTGHVADAIISARCNYWLTFCP